MIFSRSATRVLAWVGEHSHESEALFRSRPLSQSLALLKMSLFNAKPVHFMPKSRRRAAIWNAFLKRPYWTRTWVIQEIVLAGSLLIFCGDDVMTWEHMTQFEFKATWLDSRPEAYFDGLRLTTSFLHKTAVIKHLERLVLFRKALRRPFEYWDGATLCEVTDRSSREELGQAGTSTSISNLAYAFRGTSCSDPRDKVYAFLALEHQKPGTTPIYQTIAWTYTIHSSSSSNSGTWICGARGQDWAHPPSLLRT